MSFDRKVTLRLEVIGMNMYTKRIGVKQIFHDIVVATVPINSSRKRRYVVLFNFSYSRIVPSSVRQRLKVLV